MKFKRTQLMRSAVTLLVAAAWTISASAQVYPSRPVMMIVPFSAGGGADLAARLFAEKLGAALGQPVVIDNKPGASGNIGFEAGARARGDGYTLLFANESIATNPALFKQVRYDSARDFVPIAKVASNAVVIASHPSLPVKTMPELIELARTKNLNYASPGVGTGPHLFGQLLALNTGAQLTNIPYKGSAPATADAVSGQVDFIISSLSPMVPYLNAGKLRALAVTGSKRLQQTPGVPTLAETDSMAQAYEVWYGVLAPSGVPKEIVSRLQDASMQALRDPELVLKLKQAGYEVEPANGEAFGREIRRDTERWVRVIQDAKIPRE